MKPQEGRSAGTGPQTLQRTAALRVGIAVDAFAQPAWARRIVADIQGSSFARVVLLVKRPRERRGPFDRLRHLLHDAYTRLDDRLFRGEPDAFALGDVRDLLDGCPVTEPRPERVREEDLDLLIDLGPGGAADDLVSATRHGAWSLRRPAAGEALPGSLEVLEALPTTLALVEVRRPGAAPRVLGASHGPTDHISLRRNRSALRWKSRALVLRSLKDLADRGELKGEELPAPPAPPRPGNLVMAALLVRLVLRYLFGKLRHLMAREQWYLAYRFEEKSEARDDLQGLTALMPPKDRFWADPFPVRTPDGKTFVFFEDLAYRDWKGRIMVTEIGAGGATEPRAALERPYHMSYPQVFSWRGRYYMLPETSANRTVTLFRCVSFPDRWEEECHLLKDIDAVDATVAEIKGSWWMFVNVGLDGAGNRDELHLYRATSPLGPWTPHPRNPVKSDCRSARPAGAPFLRDGQLFRPAQNCGGTYGASVVIHRIDELSPTTYRETPISEIVPEKGSGASRIHTLNRCEGFLVVDLLHYRRRLGR